MTYEQIIKQVAKDTNLPESLVNSVYKGFWKFVRTTIEALPLKEDLSEEDFTELKTNFNIPSIGKLSCTYDRMLKVKKRFEYIKHLRDDKS